MALNPDTATVAAAGNSVPDTATATRSTEADGRRDQNQGVELITCTLTPAYAMSEDMSPPAIDDWNGQTHMRSPEDEPVEIVNIYTNIKPAKGMKLAYGPGAPAFTSLAVPQYRDRAGRR